MKRRKKGRNLFPDFTPTFVKPNSWPGHISRSSDTNCSQSPVHSSRVRELRNYWEKGNHVRGRAQARKEGSGRLQEPTASRATLRSLSQIRDGKGLHHNLALRLLG